MAGEVIVERSSRGAIVRLNRPDVRNAFNEAMIAGIGEAFADLGADPAVRVVVLAAAGKAFCAGADLAMMARLAGYGEAENRAEAARMAAMLAAVYQCPKPVIARVHGDCYAGGMGLAAACDFALATPEAGFCLAEVRLGLIPATIGPYLLRAVGEHAAKRHILSARRFDAAEALRIGLISGVAAAGRLDAEIEALMDTLAQNSPQAMADAKRLLRDIAGRPIDAALMQETAARIAASRASAEGREGLRAFLDKRKPGWADQ